MIFHTNIFIFLFFPITITGFYLLKRLKKPLFSQLFLIGMTLLFYGYSNLKYIVLILTSIFVNYSFFRILRQKNKKWILVIGILFNLLCLFIFKYYDFFIECCNEVLHTNFTLISVLLPIGISFYTFVQISFLSDTYHGEVKECRLLDYCSFVLFFPQLISGPIVTHNTMLPQIKDMGKRAFDLQLFSQGICLFVLGLAKKVLLADVFGLAVNWGYNNIPLLDSPNALLVMLFYTIQLYFDFSSYCDMAGGVANMLGFTLPINFNSPFKARNLIDFWKRWHMTLTYFLTHYVYIPLGGNRKGRVRTYFNILLVFLVSGLWHGPSLTFVLWGLIHGVFYMITKLCMPIIRKVPMIFTCISTFIIVNVAFVFFRSQSVSQAFALIKTICSFRFGSIQTKISSSFELPELWYAIKVFKLDGLPFSHMYCMFAYLLITFFILFFAKNTNELVKKYKPRLFTAALLGFLFVWCVLSLSDISTFLYFNF